MTYPDGSAALNISTVVNDGQFTCTYETDRAKADSTGKITGFSKPDTENGNSCTVTVSAPDGKGQISLSSDGQACSYYCGAGASLDGEFDRLER